MLPDYCVVKGPSGSLLHRDGARQCSTSLSDSDTAVLVRQNSSTLATGDLFYDSQRRQLCIRHLLVLQDLSVSLPLDRLLRTFERRTLTTLHVVDCRLGQLDDDILDGVGLRTLVLSGTQLRRLPLSFFRSSAATCDVLKVDRNRLTEIPPELGRLGALGTFCCDAQRPRLRSLPAPTLGRLTQLEVLSFSDNRIADIGWLPAALPQLRVLLCRRNRIARLPEDLAALERLCVLDVSHNRLREISASFLSVVVRLYRLEFFNSTLRPAHLRRANTASLSAHLELESRVRRQRQQRPRRRPSSESVPDAAIEEPTPRPSAARTVVERDVTIAVVGASRAGKTTLADAMAVNCRSCGLSGSIGRRGNATPPLSSSAPRGFSARHFDVMQQDGSICQLNVLVLSADDILNEYVRQINIDLFLLAFDVSALDPAGQPVNGTRSSTRRPFARLQMWLQALYEVEPDCRVVLVGTHADRVPTERLSDIWRRLVDGLLDPARPHHVLRTAAATSASRRRCSCSNCLLCRPKYLAVRHAEEAGGAVSPLDTGSFGHSSGASPAVTSADPRTSRVTGFVDLSLPVGNGAVKANATNGHVVSGGDKPAARALRFPHIVGYYETDAVTSGRPHYKDPTTVLYENVRHKPASASSSVSIERLVAAILRLTVAPSGDHSESRITPSNWLKLSRLLAAFVSNTSTVCTHLPLIGVAEVVERAKQLEMDEEETTLALRYLHRRGLVVYAPGIGDPCQLSARIVCVGATWFVQTVNRALSSLTASTVSREELARWVDHELAVQAQQRQRQSLRQSTLATNTGSGGSTTPPTAAAVHVAQQWLLDAILDVGIGLTLSSSIDNPLYLFPALLETGAPSSDVWPDLPNCGEKQVTCEFRIRSLRPGFFSDVVALVADVRRPPGRELRRLHTVPLPPLPVFLAEHVVFACSCDIAGCDDCRDVSTSATCPQTSCISRVHIALVSELDVVRVQVRSAVGTCCVMRAVLDFIDVYLDDLPDDRHVTGTCHAEDASSIESLPSYTSVGEPNVVSLSTGDDDDDDDDDERQYFLLCPKCVLLCLEGPDRIRAHRRTSTLLPSRRPACARWHHLGSWARAAVGDYRSFAFGIGSGGGSVTVCASTPPDYEYPRLVIVLPPSVSAAVRDWYLFARASFVEDVDIHLLCENPAYWHFVDGSVFRIRPQPSGATMAAARSRSVAGGGRPVPIQLVALAAAVLRVVACGQSGRLVGAVVSELVRTCGQLFPPVDFDLGVVGGDEGRERVAAMLGWMLTAVGGPPTVDLPRGLAADSAGELAVVESAVFHAPAKGSRRELARMLRAHDAGERFGVLRAVAVGHEVRWVCERHFVELRRCCMQTPPSHSHRR